MCTAALLLPMITAVMSEEQQLVVSPRLRVAREHGTLLVARVPKVDHGATGAAALVAVPGDTRSTPPPGYTSTRTYAGSNVTFPLKARLLLRSSRHELPAQCLPANHTLLHNIMDSKTARLQPGTHSRVAATLQKLHRRLYIPDCGIGPGAVACQRPLDNTIIVASTWAIMNSTGASTALV